MNRFGRLFAVEIFGESHGKGIGAVIDGCPAGVPVTQSDFENDLGRRRGGRKGTTPRIEADLPEILSGVFEGRTTGSPIALLIRNENTDSSAYEKLRFTPRPGHADLTGRQKFNGFNDYRGGGHFSGRLTAAVVAAGVIAKKVIEPVSVAAEVTEVGGLANYQGLLDECIAAGDSAGGIITCRVAGVQPGLGEPFFDSFESLAAHAVFSIPAVKGIEFGAGFAVAKMRGSVCNDPIAELSGKTLTNNNGGINGGIANGNEIFFRVAVKPTPSISMPGKTVDIRTGENIEISIGGRHDVCIALRAPVVVEAMTAMVLADLLVIDRKMSGKGKNP